MAIDREIKTGCHGPGVRVTASLSHLTATSELRLDSARHASDSGLKSTDRVMMCAL